ncbi:hypothetical protein [Pseudomonas fluorescens]|uniref:MchC protein n=2 Tax=Pseudomonas fluorescens TaxID=294 RepID=A0A944HJI7_PSEFL|nr:hypothetical protein [Pseudomonas fluorescens]MBT2296419.1 hypothetical protein [Pseudomonas fluorescens]MBT2308757.1 hypothetical protein [Pseudomonas fluorescens]MBT2312745.1 hypothetical protein [Pseudomonas fluorescens]MBT2317874.1 hypothetical protein [Pseudomonas fluorescens]MBT2330058.1 hypothetical protein [Pseudomonas fluorescens]
MPGARLSDLQEVFVPFEVEKIDGCNVIYFNEALAEGKTAADILNSYSYIVKTTASRPCTHGSVKTFMAERYGGDGILGNGGGGRCGFDGAWQLKGLGPNQLVGKNVDAGHSDGNLNLDTAIYESIWSEIINVALPFGAIRTVAILDTGRTYEVQGISTPRGLLVRQPAVRPAHFIRAIFFEENQQNGLSEDAQRVKVAIAKLGKFLPSAIPASPSDGTNKCLKSGFFELASRFAEQFAAAKAKHIIHYNVSASNLSIDGAWLDLSGTRLFTHLIAPDQIDIERFNTEYFSAIDCMKNLCYYLKKYSVVKPKVSTHLMEVTVNRFTQTYDRKLNLYQAAQAGFPLWVLRQLEDSPELNSFSRNLQKIIALNDFTVNAVNLNGGWSGYERWTARLFTDLVLNRASASAANLSWLKTHTLAIEQLLSSYKQLFYRASIISEEHSINQINLCRCMLINITRLNRSNNILHNLESRIKHIRNDPLADKKTVYQKLSDEAVFAANLSLSNEEGKQILFWLSSALSIWFDPITGMFKLHTIKGTPLSFETLINLSNHSVDIQKALSFYSEIRTYLAKRKN